MKPDNTGMKIIYVLTEGDYSDYHIVGVYSTQELAQEAQTLYPDSGIEEYDLDDIPEHPPGMLAWGVTIKDSTIGYTYLSDPHECPSERDCPNGVYAVNCWAVDEEHANKIALDKYYQHQAIKAGIV